jgi:beta-N-acetylhexosaminidase
VQRLLREELRFDGVILSDDLEMKAVSARHAVPDAAVAAIKAGCDGLLICSGNVDVQAQALEALVKAVEAGDISQARLDDAERRLRRAKQRFLSNRSARREQRAWRQIVGCDAHRAVAEEMAAFL